MQGLKKKKGPWPEWQFVISTHRRCIRQSTSNQNKQAALTGISISLIDEEGRHALQFKMFPNLHTWAIVIVFEFTNGDHFDFGTQSDPGVG